MKKPGLLRSSWDYLVDSKGYIFFALILFFLSGFFGFLFSDKLGFFQELIRGLLDRTSGVTGIHLIWFIFQNNVTSAFFALFFGVFFGLISLSNIITNGALVGYVFAITSERVGSLAIIWRLIPHGIFELPAIFIAVGLGLRLGFGFFGTYLTFYRAKHIMRAKLHGLILAIVVGMLACALSIQGLSVDVLDSFLELLFFGGLLLLIGSFFSMIYLLFAHSKLRKLQFKRVAMDFSMSLRVFFSIIVPLLIVAAIIEGILISLG